MPLNLLRQPPLRQHRLLTHRLLRLPLLPRNDRLNTADTVRE